MRKILIVLAIVVTAGFFACSDLPSDINTKDVEIVSSDNGTGSIAMLQPQYLYTYLDGDPLGGDPFEVKLENTTWDRKGTLADYLNDCLTAKTFERYVKCIKRKVKFLVSKDYLNASESTLIITWVDNQAL
ncbi:MAG: hypothetical protein PF588_01695 [Candidatus Kapabacteria bacterium]|nr:hypothetical protein [Candidatus Kapabacteria bacterium]